MADQHKLRISLQDLKVKSFVTTPGLKRDEGTVQGLGCTDCTITTADTVCTDCTDCSGCTGCTGGTGGGGGCGETCLGTCDCSANSCAPDTDTRGDCDYYYCSNDTDDPHSCSHCSGI